MGKADLHIHTTASDGALSVTELLKKVVEKGLKTISITDHDTIEGFLEAEERVADLGLDLISGVELTVIWKSHEVHLLAYDFDHQNESFLSMIANQKIARRLRMKKIVEVLKREGVDIEYDEVRAVSGNGNVGRPHAAAVLIKKGYVSSVPEAFIRYLSTEKVKTVETEYIKIEDVIEVVKGAGGVLSIAHPGRLFSMDEVKELLSFELDGIECIHPSHTFTLQRQFTELAKSNNLLITGGSDFHGKSKSDYDPYFGVVTLSQNHVESLRRSAAARKRVLA